MKNLKRGRSRTLTHGGTARSSHRPQRCDTKDRRAVPPQNKAGGARTMELACNHPDSRALQWAVRTRSPRRPQQSPRRPLRLAGPPSYAGRASPPRRRRPTHHEGSCPDLITAPGREPWPLALLALQATPTRLDRPQKAERPQQWPCRHGRPQIQSPTTSAARARRPARPQDGHTRLHGQEGQSAGHPIASPPSSLYDGHAGRPSRGPQLATPAAGRPAARSTTTLRKIEIQKEKPVGGGCGQWSK